MNAIARLLETHCVAVNASGTTLFPAVQGSGFCFAIEFFLCRPVPTID
jgi:hypothetical protein